MQSPELIAHLEGDVHPRLWPNPLALFPHSFSDTTALYVIFGNFKDVGHAKRLVAFLRENPGLVDADVLRSIENGLKVAKAQGALDSAPFSQVYPGQTGGAGLTGHASAPRKDPHVKLLVFLDRHQRLQ